MYWDLDTSAALSKDMVLASAQWLWMEFSGAEWHRVALDSIKAIL